MRRVEAERRQEHKMMEDHLDQCIYDIQQSDSLPAEKLSVLNKYETNVVRLKHRRLEKLMPDTNDYDRNEGEEPNLFYVLKTMNRRDAPMIRQMKGRRCNIIEAAQDIAHNLVAHLREKYGLIDVDESCVAMMIDVVQPTDWTTTPPIWNR
jgi:hypothetical protein